MFDVNGGDDCIWRDQVWVILEEKWDMSEYLECQICEVCSQQEELDWKYLYMDGGKMVLGLEVFVRGGVLNWKGVNYVLQEYEQMLCNIWLIVGIYCGVFFELLYDVGMRILEFVLWVYQFFYDELILMMFVLVEEYLVVFFWLFEGME